MSPEFHPFISHCKADQVKVPSGLDPLSALETAVPWAQNAEREISSAATSEPAGQLFPTLFCVFFYCILSLCFARKINSNKLCLT